MLIEKLRLKNIQSFRGATIEPGTLNVLTGPNGIQKSHPAGSIGRLPALPAGLALAIMGGGMGLFQPTRTHLR